MVLAVEIRLRMRPASLPSTSNLLMKLMSMSATLLRQPWCSAAHCSNQWCRPHDKGPGSVLPSLLGAYQSAPSHPLTSLNDALCSASLWWSGDLLTLRAVLVGLCG